MTGIQADPAGMIYGTRPSRDRQRCIELLIIARVRREALLIRVEVRDLPPLTLSQQGGEAGGSLIREAPGRVGAAPDKAGTRQYCQMARVRRAWRRGVREEPALLRLLTIYRLKS